MIKAGYCLLIDLRDDIGVSNDQAHRPRYGAQRSSGQLQRLVRRLCLPKSLAVTGSPIYLFPRNAEELDVVASSFVPELSPNSSHL